MKEHLPRVYWRDVPPEDTNLLAPGQAAGKTADAAGGWTDFRPLADAYFRDLDHREDRLADGAADSSSLRTGSLIGPPGKVLRELAPPRALSLHELEEPAVQRLVASNPYSERSVLIPSGTIFLGGAQNRVIRGPALVPPGLHELPVYCVEMGRWDMSARKFEGLTRLPGLLTHKFDDIPAGDLQERQGAVWELVYESLTMLGQLNPTLNVNGWRAPQGQEPAASPAPEDWRGQYSIDPESGLASLMLAPHDDFGGLSQKAFARDLDWRKCLRGNARGAREFYRIFDEEKNMAIRCMPDGRALNDIHNRPILFEYGPSDLERSFRPPIEKPPEPPPLSFASEKFFTDLPDFLEAIRGSRARLTRIGEDAIFNLELAHPEKSLRGRGLVYRNQLASLDVTAFRPYAKVS